MKVKSITGKVFRLGRRVVVTGAVTYTAFKAAAHIGDRVADKKAAELK